MMNAAAFSIKNLPPGMGWLKPFLANAHFREVVTHLIALMQNPEMQKNALLIVKNHHLEWLYGGFVAVTIFYLLVKYRVLGGIKKWWLRFLARLVLAVSFFAGQVLMAYAILGRPLGVVAGLVYEAFGGRRFW